MSQLQVTATASEQDDETGELGKELLVFAIKTHEWAAAAARL